MLTFPENRKVRRTSLNWLAQAGHVPVSRARSFAEDTYRLKDEETYTPNNVFLSLRIQRQLKPQNRNKYRCFPEILKCPGTQDLEDNKPTKKRMWHLSEGSVVENLLSVALYLVLKKVKGEKRNSSQLWETAPIYLGLLCKAQKSFSVTIPTNSTIKKPSQGQA